MKNYHSLTFSVFFLLLGYTIQAQVTFYKNYQNGLEDSQVFDITALSSGGYAMVGIAGNSGQSFCAVTKIDCDGDVEWAKMFGGSSTIDNVFSSIIEADNGDIIFVNNVGSFQNYDIIVVRITPGGNVVWKKRYGGNQDDAGRSIVQTQDGNFVITGETSSFGSDTGSGSYSDLYLFKIDGANGDVIWSKTYGNPGAIDGGFAITEDNAGNLFSTGRFLVGGTFYAYILKTDANGDIIFFKGLGYPNHRTYGYDIKVNPVGEIIVTGSTTINKQFYNSYSDVFLIKTDPLGVPIFANIYYPNQGNDRSESGSSVVLQQDGGYGIGVPTLSFTPWTSGNVPNKNVVYQINENGSINSAYLYNQGASHYTRLREDLDRGYIMSAFSTFFSPNFEFIPLIIKMDANYQVGCNMIDATAALTLAVEQWDFPAITYVAGTGHQAFSFSPENDFQYTFVDNQCTNVPAVVASFVATPSGSGNTGAFDFTNTSLVPGQLEWNFGDGSPTSTAANPTHQYTASGVYEVCMTLYGNCTQNTICEEVEAIIGSCPSVLSLTTPVAAGLYTAGSELNCTSNVVGTTVGFQAGSTVKLDNGFSTPASSNFSAAIRGCVDN